MSDHDLKTWMKPGVKSVSASGRVTPSNNGHTEDEPPKDPGSRTTHQSYTEQDFEGHRAHTMYVGVHLPGEKRHRRHHKHHYSRSGDSDGKEDTDDERPEPAMTTKRVRLCNISDPDGEKILTPPAQRVQFILGGEVGDDAHESHPLFSEMEELIKDGDEMTWKETARWIKFEEDVEEGGNRWSKPHVATLSLHALFELRSLLLNGTVMLDMEATR